MSTYCYTKRFYEVKPNPDVIWLNSDLDTWDSILTTLVNYIRMFEDGACVSTRLIYNDNVKITDSNITGYITIVWDEHATKYYPDGSPVYVNKPRYSQEELAHIINTYSKLGIIMERDGGVSGSYPE